MLNNDDPCVQNNARDSLKLHMSKRKVPLAQNTETSFAGYSVTDNKLNKNTSVNWPKSFWVNVFEMCQRECISLRLRGDKYVFQTLDDDDIELTIESHKGFKMYFKQRCNDATLNCWRDLSSQGRYIRESNDIDVKLSMHIYDNHKISDKIRNFITKCRLQLLPCQSLLSLYYPNIHNKQCQMCNCPYETVSHVLNGCQLFKNLYQSRHNTIVNLLHDKIVSANETCKVYKDKVLTPTLFDSSESTFNHTHKRPDIVVVNKEEKSAILIEVSIPFDCHIEKCYQGKFNKYFPLSQEINDCGFHTQIVVLLVGSMGSVHKKFVNGLKKNNINGYEAKFLAKYCSISAQIGSYKVWKRRCSQQDVLLNENI